MIMLLLLRKEWTIIISISYIAMNDVFNATSSKKGVKDFNLHII